jgi:Sec-independent protein translocase protein TatA
MKGVLVLKLILILAIVALVLGATRLRRPARSAGPPERQNGSGGA